MASDIKVGDPGERLHYEANAQFYAPGVLQPAAHRRLVEDIRRVAEDTRIPIAFITRSMKDFGATPEEIAWVAGFRARQAGERTGLVLHGGPSPMARMQAMGGAFLRNFINVRFLPVQELCSMLKDGAAPEARVVIVPNFYSLKGNGGDLPSWQTSLLLGWLMDCFSTDRVVILHVESMSSMDASYGGAYGELLNANCTLIKV